MSFRVFSWSQNLKRLSVARCGGSDGKSAHKNARPCVKRSPRGRPFPSSGGSRASGAPLCRVSSGCTLHLLSPASLFPPLAQTALTEKAKLYQSCCRILGHESEKAHGGGRERSKEISGEEGRREREGGRKREEGIKIEEIAEEQQCAKTYTAQHANEGRGSCWKKAALVRIHSEQETRHCLVRPHTRLYRTHVTRTALLMNTAVSLQVFYGAGLISRIILNSSLDQRWNISCISLTSEDLCTKVNDERKQETRRKCFTVPDTGRPNIINHFKISGGKKKKLINKN